MTPTVRQSDAAAVRDLVRSRRPGYGLPAPFYSSPDLYALDLAAVFGRSWFFAGSEPEVPEPGDYLTVDVGPWSVLLVRDDDEQVRAFHNVCRHRGSRLVDGPDGTVGNLVCPYHAWTYRTDGRLVHAESAGPEVDPACFSLKPVQLRSVAGLLFVSLAAEPPEDFAEMAAAVAPYLEPHGLRRAKVAHREDLVEQGNWKLVMENNRECYHCGGHPELGRSLFPSMGYPEEEIGPSRRASWERSCAAADESARVFEKEGLPWREVSELTGRETGYYAERTALDGAGESITPDTRAASRRLMGRFTGPRMGRQGLHVQPNCWHHLMADHAVTFSVLPLGPERTLLRTVWLVHEDAVEGVDYDRETLVSVWRTTNAQDAAFVERTQRGVDSPAFEPGPFSPAEGWVDDFCTWYLERIEAHLDGEVPR